MYDIQNAAAFDTACAAPDRVVSLKCEVTSGGGATTEMVGGGSNGEIVSFEWTNIACPNDGIQIGTTCMDEFMMKYRFVSTNISIGSRLVPYIGVDVNDTPVYVPLGVFWVTNVETEDDGVTYDVTAYDSMVNTLSELDAEAMGITLPIKAWDLLAAIADHLGFTIEYDEETYTLLASDAYLLTVNGENLVVNENIIHNTRTKVEQAYDGSYRDYIGWIAGLVGGNAHFGRDGSLIIARYADHGFQIIRDVQYLKETKIKYNGAVEYHSIVSGTDEAPVYPVGYGGNAFTFTNPFINSEELTLVCDYIIGDGITVTPCDIRWRSNPRVDAGDVVSVIDKDGNALPVYVMERVVSVSGGMSEELHCYAETETQKILNASPMQKKLTQVSQTAAEASDYINNTKGTFQYIDNGDGTNGGFTIYEAGGMAFLRCTAGGIGLSKDGGITYTNAITKNGIVATQLNVIDAGVRVVYAGFTSTAGQKTSAMYFRDPYYNKNTVIVQCYRTTNGGGAMLMVNGANSDGGIEIDTSYDDESRQPNNSIVMYDGGEDAIGGRYPNVRLSARSQGLNHESYISFGTAEGKKIMAVGRSNDAAYMEVYLPAIDDVITLGLRKISINGIGYYVMAAEE